MSAPVPYNPPWRPGRGQPTQRRLAKESEYIKTLMTHCCCFFIKVCTKEEQEILQRDSNKSQKLRKKLMGGETQNLSELLNTKTYEIKMWVDAMHCFYFGGRRRKRLSPTPRGHDEGWSGEGCPAQRQTAGI